MHVKKTWSTVVVAIVMGCGIVSAASKMRTDYSDFRGVFEESMKNQVTITVTLQSGSIKGVVTKLYAGHVVMKVAGPVGSTITLVRDTAIEAVSVEPQ